MNLLHYGLQRSGTNFLESLLKKNYQVNFLNSDKDRRSPLQKHCRFYKNKELIPEPQYCNEIIVDEFEQFESLFKVEPDYYLIISKDPYSWYLSYRSWADECNWPNVTHHYIEEYNQFYKTFMEFSSQSDKFLFVRYIDLIEDTGAVLDALENRMELKRKLLSRLKLKKSGKVSQSNAFSESKRTYYLNQEYLKKYSAEDLRIVNELLDPEVISFLGYESLGLVN
jgi:hypothetical protein